MQVFTLGFSTMPNLDSRLGKNLIGNKGAMALGDALVKNTTLTLLRYAHVALNVSSHLNTHLNLFHSGTRLSQAP